jgi:hypothetical protein
MDATLIPKKYSGTGAPSIVTGSLIGDEYLDTAAGDTYKCFGAGPCVAVAAGNWVKVNGGGTGGTLSMSNTGAVREYVQQFCRNGGYAGSLGTKQWISDNPSFDGNGGPTPLAATDMAHECIMRFNTGAITNNSYGAYDGGGGTNILAGLNTVPASGSFQIYWRWRPVQATLAQYYLRANTAGGDDVVQPADALGFYVDTSQSANIRVQICAAGTCNGGPAGTDTGVTIIAGNWYYTALSSTASGVWTWTVISSAGTATGTITATTPGALMRMEGIVKTLTAAVRQLDLETVAFYATGQTAY